MTIRAASDGDHKGLMPTEPEARLTMQLLEQRSVFLRFLAAKIGPEAAEDILQSCYLKLVEKGPQLQKEESVVSWFYTVLRHATVDYYRRNATRNRAHEQFAADTPVSYETELKANICQCLPGVLETLKPEYREALQAVDVDGQSVAEYAKAEGTTPNNAGVRLHRARKAAAKRLTQVCGACAEHKCLDCTCRRPEV
jgi:RNA polymerase sigma factor (sigma-70 family)